MMLQTTLQKRNRHSPVVREETILRLLFADDVAVSCLLCIEWLTKWTDEVEKLCKNWKFNFKKTKVMIFKNGGELKKNGELHMVVQKLEVVNEVIGY